MVMVNIIWWNFCLCWGCVCGREGEKERKWKLSHNIKCISYSGFLSKKKKTKKHCHILLAVTLTTIHKAQWRQQSPHLARGEKESGSGEIPTKGATANGWQDLGLEAWPASSGLKVMLSPSWYLWGQHGQRPIGKPKVIRAGCVVTNVRPSWRSSFHWDKPVSPPGPEEKLLMHL